MCIKTKLLISYYFEICFPDADNPVEAKWFIKCVLLTNTIRDNVILKLGLRFHCKTNDIQSRSLPTQFNERYH